MPKNRVSKWKIKKVAVVVVEKELLESLCNKNVKLTIETIMPNGIKFEFAVHGRILDIVGNTARIINTWDKQQLYHLDRIVGAAEL